MRTTIWCTILGTALFAGTACETRETQKAGAAMRDTQEDVARQEQRTAADLAKLDRVEARAAAARADFANAAMIRLSRIDSQIEVLAANPDVGSQEAATALRAERNAFVGRLHTLESQDLSGWTNDQWKSTKRDIEHNFEKIEKQLDHLKQDS